MLHQNPRQKNPSEGPTEERILDLYVQYKKTRFVTRNPRSQSKIRKFYVQVTNLVWFNEMCNIPEKLFHKIEANKRALLKVQIYESTPPRVIEVL